MIKRIPRRVLTLLLACVCICGFSGCAFVEAIADGVLPSDDGRLTSEPTPTAAPPAAETAASPGGNVPALEPVEAGDRPLVPFPEMVYIRPNVESMTAELNELARALKTVEDENAASQMLDRANDIMDAYSTAATLALIHTSIDFSDQHWASEYSYCSAAATTLQEAAARVQAALVSSPAGQAAGVESGTLDDLYAVPEMLDLFDQETAIQNQVANLLGTLTVNVEGNELTYAQVSGSSYTAWLQENGEVLGELYADLLRTRLRIAQAAGYDSYLDFLFDVNEMEYTPEMLDELLNQIEETMVPLYRQVESLGVYPIDVEFTEDSAFSYMSGWFSRLNPQLNEALDLMRGYQLYDFSAGPYKDATPFTTYIDDYQAPFLMAAFTGTYSDLQDVLHEFGHFFHYTQDPDASLVSTDISEILSTSLPLLVSNLYAESFGSDEGYYMLYNQLADDLGTFVYQSYFAGFELAAYRLPMDDISLEALCTISQSQWDRFGLSGNAVTSALDWVSTSHLYESALYVASYILAEDVSLQLWELSLDDVSEAQFRYEAVLNGAASGLPLLADLEQAGLRSPFAAGEIRTQASCLEQYLLDDDFITDAFFGASGLHSEEQAVPEEEEFPDPEERFGAYFGYSDGSYAHQLEDAKRMQTVA